MRIIPFRTVSGLFVDLARMRTDDIRIGDIAKGLSLGCRFGYQVHKHYSIAQHSLLVASMVDADIFPNALFHDASEAYLGDVTHHLKHHPGMSFYRGIEADVTAVIEDALGLHALLRDQQQQLKDVDALAGIFEHWVLRERWSWNAAAAIRWANDTGFNTVDYNRLMDLAPQLHLPYSEWSAEEAERLFLLAVGGGLHREDIQRHLSGRSADLRSAVCT